MTNCIAPPVLEMLTHDEGMKPCFVATSVAVLTVEMPEQGHFAALVVNQPGSPVGAVVLLDRRELEAQVELLRNAIHVAERMDVGLEPIHAAHDLTRN